MKDINIPNGLTSFGATKEDLPKMREATLKIQQLQYG
jgi:hypothetical protein